MQGFIKRYRNHIIFLICLILGLLYSLLLITREDSADDFLCDYSLNIFKKNGKNSKIEFIEFIMLAFCLLI